MYKFGVHINFEKSKSSIPDRSNLFLIKNLTIPPRSEAVAKASLSRILALIYLYWVMFSRTKHHMHWVS